MKKGLLLLSSVLGLATLAHAQKLSLFEEFSGENCGPCASANPALMTLLGNNPSKVLLLKYQSPIPSGGPIYAQNTTDVQARMTYYSVPFAPYGRNNGAEFGSGANVSHVALLTQAMIDAAALESTPFTLSIGTPTITGTTFSVPVTITATGAASFSNAKLRFALVEDLEFSTPPGSNGETSFHHVMRKMYPDATGTTVQSSFTSGQTQVITVTGTIPTYVSAESPRMFIAWVQNDADKMVLQAAKSGALPAAPNALASDGITVANKIQCGATATFTPVVTIKNTGTAALTSAKVYIKSGTGAYGAPQSWTGNIAPGATGTFTASGVTVNAYGETSIVDSLAMPNGVVDADASNNATGTFVYLLNATTETLPQANDFEAASPMWVGLPGVGGNPMFNVNVSSFASTSIAGTGYSQSQNALVFPCYLIGPGSTGFYTIPKADMAPAQKALDFYVSYVQYQSENDKLEVVYSTDCGVTWTSVWNKSGSSLSTKAASTSFFKPNGNADWRMESVNVSAVPAGARIALRATSAYGNNIWVDNVKLRVGVPTGINNVVEENSVKVFPNPINTDLNITFDLKKSTTVTVNVVNALGQEMPMSNSTLMTAGSQTVKLNAASLAAGVYFVNIVTEEGTIRKQFVKQ